MAKLTKFKAQQVEFPTHYKVEDTNRGDTKIKNIIPAFGTVRENGTPETEEIYNGLQLGSIHTLQANKTTNLNIDYYVCNLDGLTEFGLNNDLKLRVNVDSENTNTTTKLRLNNVDYTLLKEHNGTLKQIEVGDFKSNKSYELVFNGSQFIVTNITEYGTTKGTALEGNRLAEIIGLEFGGNIQDTGNKVKGKFYFDNVTKFYYECTENTNLTYNDSGKFRAISNKPISDKVENLSKTETKIIEKGIALFKVGNIVILTWDSNYHLSGSLARGTVLATLPEGYRPILDVSTPVSFWNSNNSGTIKIRNNGQITWESSINFQGTIYVNSSFLTS